MRTVDRTLEIFEAFAEAKRPLSLSELARMINMPVSSCHGLLRTLQKSGYMFALEVRRRYYPTRRLFEVGAALAAHDPIADRLIPVMEKIREETNETILLGQRQDDHIVYLHVLESSQMIRYAAPIGALKPLPSTGIGKAFLGELSDDELAAYLSKIDLVQITPSTIVNREQLLADVQRSRKRGYFVTRGENIPDVMAIARAFEMEGEHLAIAVAGPIHRLEPKISNIGQVLISATAAVGQIGQTSKLAMK